MKKMTGVLLAAFCFLFVWSNTVLAANFTTSYGPWINEGTESEPNMVVESPFALQRPGYPWCMNTCMKMVLKNALQRHLGTGTTLLNANGPGEASIDFAKINALINPEDAAIHMPSRYDIEGKIVKNVLLNGKAIGEIGTFSAADAPVQGEFRDLIRELFGFCLVADKVAEERVKATNTSREFNLLNGLLWSTKGTDLQTLVWEKLNDNTRKMIVQDSPQAVLDTVQHMTSTGAADSGLKGTIVNVADYATALNEIANEIREKRMVIVFFRNPADLSESHACVVSGACFDGAGGSLAAVGIYNPWGCAVVTTPTGGSTFNIDTRPGGIKRNWELFQYVKFNY
jgi:hypothetical protein